MPSHHSPSHLTHTLPDYVANPPTYVMLPREKFWLVLKQLYSMTSLVVTRPHTVVKKVTILHICGAFSCVNHSPD